MPEVLILTGPPGAGKSTVAEALAERYDRVAHVPVDTLRHLITPTGFISAGRPGFERQARLGMRNACDLALNFLTERIAVIIDDVVIAADDLDFYVQRLRPAGVPIHYVRLFPTLDVCQQRNRDRRSDRVRPERVDEVWRLFQDAGDIGGSTIDSSALSAYEAADRLQALTTSGASIVWRPGATSGIVVVPRGAEHEAWAAEVLVGRWGSTQVVSRGVLHDAARLPGFVALTGGWPQGLATYRIDGDACEIVTLDSAREGAGTGTALIEAVKQEALSHGCKRLWLTTTNDNLHALRFYQRRGFRLAGLYPGAADAARALKPAISAIGLDDIPIRDEIELEMSL